MKSQRRMISAFLSLCFAIGLLPTVAMAEDADPSTTTTTHKTLMLGTSGISDPTKNAGSNEGKYYYTPNSYIYFGENGSTPIKWRVLDADKANDGTTSGIFLLSEYLLTRNTIYFQELFHQDGSNYYKGSTHDDGDHTNCVTANVYQGSDAQKWCTDFATSTSNFSAAEQDAMLGVAKTDDATKLYDCLWGSSSLTTDDKLFFLSAQELTDYIGNYDRAPGLKASRVGAQRTSAWCLRSPHANKDNHAGMVNDGGALGAISLDINNQAARPAFNLDLDAILFTSAAENGKNGTVGELSEINDYTGNEWKLTILDSNRNFKLTEKTVAVQTGDTVMLTYTGASTGANEYISIVLVDDEGNATHYGKMASVVSESGTVTISIPSDFAEGDYTLKVFNEQINGDQETDYASAFQTVMLTVDSTAPTLTKNTTARDSESTATVTFTSSEAATYYYTVTESDAAAPEQNDILNGTSAACSNGNNTISITGLSNAAPKKIYLVAKDAAENISDTLVMDIPIWPIYNLTLSSATLDFGTGSTTKYAVPNEQTVTVTNTGNMAITLNEPTATNYAIGDLSATNLAANGGTATFTIQPKANLAVGTYNETITITDSTGNVSASVNAQFAVEKKSISIISATAVDRDYGEGDTNVEISGVTFDSVALTKDTDYTATGIIADADAENHKAVSVTVTLTEEAARDYILIDNTTTTTVTIHQISYTGVATALGSAKYGNSGEVDLSHLIMPGGTAAIGTVTDHHAVLDSYSIGHDTSLKFQFHDDSELVDKTATVQVNVTGCTNYENYKIIVTVTVTNKQTPTLTIIPDKTTISGGGTVMLSVGGLPTGASYTITCDHTSCNPTENDGVWSVTLPNVTATYYFTVTFAGNSEYNGVTATCKVSVTQYTEPVTPPSNDQNDNSGSDNGSNDNDDDTNSGNGNGGNSNTDNGSNNSGNSNTDNGGSNGGNSNTNNGNNNSGNSNTDNGGSNGGNSNTDNGSNNSGNSNSDNSGNNSGNTTTNNTTNDGSNNNNSSNGNTDSGSTDNSDSIVENSKRFDDVKDSDYFSDAVDWASSRGITSGVTEKTFGPNEFCTRAQLVTFLWRAAGQPTAETLSDLTDIADDFYYTEAIHWAAEQGIVNGYGNGLFGTDDTITREQVVAILHRFAQKMGMDLPQSHVDLRVFHDYQDISAYAVSSIQWAVNAGILQGDGTSLMPTAECTRAQIVTMLYRFLSAATTV